MMTTALLAASLILNRQTPGWKTEFVGRKDFAQCTRVLALPDRIFFMDSPPPYEQDGGDLWVWRDLDAKAGKVLSVKDKGISVIRQFQDKMYVPGMNAIQDREWGNWYVSGDTGDTWRSFHNVPRSRRVNDVAVWRHRLYLAVSDPGGGSVMASDNQGVTWGRPASMKPVQGAAQITHFLVMSDGLYAFWALDPQGDASQDCLKFDGDKWTPTKLFPGVVPVNNPTVFGDYAVVFSNPVSYFLKDGKAGAIPSTQGLAFSDGAQPDPYSMFWLARDPKLNHSSLYRSTVDPRGPTFGSLVKVMELPDHDIANSIAIHNGKVFCACTGESQGLLLSIPLATVR